MRQDDVLGFDVPVENVRVVHVAESLADLPHLLRDLFFGHSSFTSDAAVEGPFLHVLHHDVEVESITEKAVNLDDVGMVRVEIYLQLHHELVKHQLNVLFLDLLDGHQKSTLFMTSRVDFAEAALSLARTKLKIINFNLNCRRKWFFCLH